MAAGALNDAGGDRPALFERCRVGEVVPLSVEIVGSLISALPLEGPQATSAGTATNGPGDPYGVTKENGECLLSRRSSRLPSTGIRAHG
jgi:hypothetical protein